MRKCDSGFCGFFCDSSKAQPSSCLPCQYFADTELQKWAYRSLNNPQAKLQTGNSVSPKGTGKLREDLLSLLPRNPESFVCLQCAYLTWDFSMKIYPFQSKALRSLFLGYREWMALEDEAGRTDSFSYWQSCFPGCLTYSAELSIPVLRIVCYLGFLRGMKMVPLVPLDVQKSLKVGAGPHDPFLWEFSPFVFPSSI